MAPVFLGPSTTTVGWQQKSDADTLDNHEDSSSIAYVLGILVFSVLFFCVFALICRQVKAVVRRKDGVSATTDASSASSSKSQRLSSVSSLPSASKLIDMVAGKSQLVVLGQASSLPAASPEHLAWSAAKVPAHASSAARGLRQPKQGRPPLRAAGSFVSTQSEDDLVWSEPCEEDDIKIDEWVGSAEWEAFRSARKARLGEMLRRGVFAKPPPGAWDLPPEGSKEVQPPGEEVPVPPTPVATPPTLNIVEDKVDGAAQANIAVKANAEVREELQRTAQEDLLLRKQKFKGLCARWHPDKHVLGDVELATEVFQFLQAQKSWYLHDQVSPMPFANAPSF